MMNNSMKEGLILAVALGLAVAAAQAFTADRPVRAPALPSTLVNTPISHPSSNRDLNHRLLCDRR